MLRHLAADSAEESLRVPSLGQYPAAMDAVRRYAWLVFLLFALLLTLFGIFPGSWFEEGVDGETALLTATFAAVAVVLTVAVAVTAFRQGEPWAWWAFWVWPLFFVVHGIAFFVVDFVFAALGVAALAMAAPKKKASG
jgi:hypothetical protein